MAPQDRFTNNFREVAHQAAWICLTFGEKVVTSDHLLIGICLIPSCLAAEILKKLGVDKASFERLLGTALSSLDQAPNTPGLGFGITKEEVAKLSLSEGAIKTIEKAALSSFEYRHQYIGTEHLLGALLGLRNKLLLEVLKRENINLSDLDAHIKNVLKSTSKFAEVTSSFSKGLKKEEGDKKLKDSKTPALDYFTVNLTSDAVQKKMDPIIGRDREIDRLINILSRRTKNNPVLIGDPGVGKTAVVEGLAQKIAAGQVPDILLSKQILNLDLSLVVAGTIYRGEFEGRLKQIIDEAKNNPNIVLFIDEIHNLVGAGSASGSLDAANILKPALARGEISCIGATTLEEYKKHIEGDAALERRFQPIFIQEPSLEETIEVLKGIRKNYEKYHRITISDDAIEEAVNLSERFLPDKFFPDKAIDLIDEAASRVKVLNTKEGLLKEIRKLTEEVRKIAALKEKALMEERFTDAADHKKKEYQISLRLSSLEQKEVLNQQTTIGAVSAEDIIKVVSQIINVPFLEKAAINRNKLLNLEKILSKKIAGQDVALKEISATLRRSQAGLADPKKPLASFIFLGPSGVGKTETARVIAEEVFGNKDALIRVDMSEFSEAFNISKLIGSPPGYVGYKDANKFTDAVRKRPYSVVLFDEMEKAHPEVFNLFLQILEDGHVTDASSKYINFKNSVVIFTSNIGVESLNKCANIGFEGSTGEKSRLKEEFLNLKENILKELREQFRVEFLNRIDKIIFFEPLDKRALAKIVDLKIDELNERISKRNLKLELTKKAEKFLVERSFIPDQGARGVRHAIQDLIENTLVDKLLKEDSLNGKVLVDVKRNKLVLD